MFEFNWQKASQAFAPPLWHTFGHTL